MTEAPRFLPETLAHSVGDGGERLRRLQVLSTEERSVRLRLSDGQAQGRCRGTIEPRPGAFRKAQAL